MINKNLVVKNLVGNWNPVLLDDISQIIHYSDALSHSLASCSVVITEYPVSHHIDTREKEIEEEPE